MPSFAELFTDCEGYHRRDFLKAGTLGLMGLGLSNFLRMEKAAHAGSHVLPTKGKAKSAVLLWMAGGPSHLDLWDLKPDAPAEIRGLFDPIKTNVPGIEISEILPKTAQIMDKVCLLRSMHTSEGAHERGTHLMNTGYQPLPGFAVPAYGSAVSKLLGPAGALPPYIAVPSSGKYGYGGAGFLGAAYDPFETGGNPASANFKVRDLDPPGGMSFERVDRRKGLRAAVDQSFKKFEKSSNKVQAVDEFYSTAYRLLSSKESRAAFDIKSEPAKLRDAYGRHSFGQGCLLARRLVEAGVRFVSVDMGGWDTHNNNFPALRDGRAPQFDGTYATFLKDLSSRGLLDETLVIVMGEFGRTPVINRDAGRDHYPGVFTVALAGGGIHGGTVVGTSDERGSKPALRPVTPQDLAATVYWCLGISPENHLESPEGIRIVLSRGGKPIKEAIG